jgi:chemotaxis protein histidine kinase CheA
MANPKIDNAAVKTFADHEVILPPNKLKKAVVKPRPNEAGILDPVARAEQALADLSGEFSDWMDKDCARLYAARHALKTSGLSKENCDELFRSAHDIRGQADTFGYPLAAPVADSLCRLLEHTPDQARIPLGLIDHHVDGIRAIVHKNAQGNAEQKAKRLAERLRQVTDEFLAHENRHRPDYLEDIVTPPLAPTLPSE